MDAEDNPELRAKLEELELELEVCHTTCSIQSHEPRAALLSAGMCIMFPTELLFTQTIGTLHLIWYMLIVTNRKGISHKKGMVLFNEACDTRSNASLEPSHGAFADISRLLDTRSAERNYWLNT
jgi:hypothetical protein